MLNAFIVIVFLMLLFTAVGFIFSGKVIHPKHISHEQAMKRECEKGRIDRSVFEAMEREDVSIYSPYGYRLHGWFFPNPDRDGKVSLKTVIICHGINYNMLAAVKYMDMFTKRGFNVLMYDHRCHGASGGRDTTFGYYEKYDLKAWVGWFMKGMGAALLSEQWESPWVQL